MSKHICAESAYMSDSCKHTDICLEVDEKFSEEQKAYLREHFEMFLDNYSVASSDWSYFHVNGLVVSTD